MWRHSRWRAVGLAWQTVSGGIAVFPHSMQIALDATGTPVHTILAVLEIPTLRAMLSTLRRKQSDI